MSLSRNNKIWSVAESLLERLGNKKRSANRREQKPKKLFVDQLEERQLLSLTVASTENLLVNPSWQDIRGDIAVDSNKAGDVVVAWTSADRLLNPDYDANDPESSYYKTDENGAYVEDLNVYARYLTDEVQIVTIPQESVPGTLLADDGQSYDSSSYTPVTAKSGWYEVTTTGDDGSEQTLYVKGTIQKGTKALVAADGTVYPFDSYVALTTGWYEVSKTNAAGEEEATVVQGSIVQAGSFELLFNANESQRFSIYDSGVLRGENDTYNTSNSISYFYIGLYAENELTWTLFKYDANLLPGDNAANLQAAIRAIPGGEYSEVTVNAYSETDFDITFNGENWAGYDLPDMRVSNNYYADITNLLSTVKASSFDITDLNGATNFQKLILRDLFGTKYTTKISEIINTVGKGEVIRQLQVARDSLVDTLTSGVVTTVNDVKTITAYNNNGNKSGLVVNADPYVTAQAIQNAFNNASNTATLYAPITRGYEYNETTHRYEYTSEPTRAYASNESYGSMQAAIKTLEVKVEPVPGANNQFMITFTGASGLTNQDSLIVSAATSVTKSGKTYVYSDLVRHNNRTGAYEYTGSYDYDVATATVTVKESSEVFRVNSTEIAEFVIDGDGDIVNDREGLPLIAGTGRTNQYKPSVAVSNDGSFVITWVSDNPDSLQRYNQTDVYARRFTVQGYLPEPGEGGYDPNYTVNFYANGTTDGQLGYQPPETAFDTSFVADPFALDASSNVKIQCVAPVAAEFVVNASLNGIQTDPCVSADEDGNFIVTWTYIAQDNSYFGGIYGRQFNNEAQPTTGDITFASSQVSSNYYGPSYVAMSSDGFAVVTWNYGTDFYQSVLEPYNDVFIIDAQLVASNAYGSSVSFDYNDRYALAFTQEEADGVGGTPALPVTNSYVTVYEISAVETEPEDTDVFATSTSNGDTNANNNTNGNDNQTNAAAASGVIAVGERKTSTSYEAAQILGQTLVNAITVGDQGNPSVGMDADGDVFVAYQGLGLDIQSITKANLANLYASDYDDLYIQLKWEDFENNNLCYKHKQFYRGNKYSYEDKNADLISFIQLALGWGYDELGNFTDNGATPIYQIHNYDCIDVDSYIRYFLSVAQKEGATTEQITRLDAVLETMLAPLRNNGYDVSYVNYGQTVYGDSIANANASTNTDSTNGNTDANAQVNIITDASVISGVVSSYRNGSNACFYLSLPTQYVSSGTLAFNIGIATARDNQTTNEDTCESVSFGIGDYFSNGFLTRPLEMADALSDALNALNMCAGEDNCFVVRLVPLSEIEFYQGTIGEIGLDVEQFQYLYKYTQDSVEYYGMRTVDGFVGLQITAQGSLHDTPLYIRPDYDATSLKLLDQASDDADYGFYTGLYVERYGELGNLQTNAHVANTSNGDVIVVWGKEANTDAKSRNDLYPNIGNSLDVEYSHVYLRAFTESTDTAGPIVTNTSLPNGQKVDDNQTVTSAVKDMVVSFSEDLLTLADAENAATLQDSSYIRLHAVDNVSNWYLLEDGVIVAGAIESVTFGLNASEQLARDTVDENGNPIEQINYGDLAYGTNRYEAVVHFADGFEPDDGNYTLVCSSMVQDTARNAIYSQGYAPDGSSAGYDGKDWALDFSVIRLNEALGFTYTDSFRYNDYIPVTYVHDTAADGSFEHDAVDTNRVLNQTTRSSIVDESSDYGPNTAQAIASNSNGDSVVVWVESEESVDASGKYQITKTVYARTYRALYVLDAEGNRSQVISQDKSEGVLIEVYSDTGTYNSKGVLTSTVTGKEFTDPRQASVAMDDKGEFCVVWDMYTDAQGEDGSRDVYMAKYAFNGGRMSINGNSTDPMRANVETDEDQQYAAVAMDSDGDIVVVWESYNQDGSGWGIYGRRFVTNGLSYGYQNTIQVLQFVGTVNILGDVLTISGAADGQDYTVAVPLSVEMRANATNIKAALVGTGLFTETDLEVAVSAAGEISIEYKGEYTATYVDMMEVSTNNPDLIVNVEMRQTGVAGTEFLVNQTTENNQRFAAIGMEPDGSFVVSWTSWGQDLDSDVESNIYARKFASNHVVSAHLGTLEEMTRARTEIGGGSSSLVDTTNDTSKVISTDSIEYHEVYPGQGYESVCMITVGETTNTQQQGGTNADAVAEAIGTGSLLTSRRHVLTAAHVVCNDAGVPVDPSEELVYVTFETKSGTVYIRVSEIYVHPTYAGDPSDNQVDLAVLVLESAAPSSLRGYDLYTGSSEVGQTVTFVGYGTYGDVMDTDEEIANRGIGVKHEGQNVYELTGADFDNAGNPNTLIYDFDDGSYANDYLGNYYGVRNLGLGLNEAITAPGDSGSPTFINGQIAGVCSFGSDLEGDGAFGPGNYQVDVRVSAYADWINSVILSGLGDEFLVNTDGNIYIDVDTDDNTDNQNNNQNNNNTQAAVDELTTDFWQRGSQIWSSVSMDGDGNFVITWTGYNQDGNGDAMTGGSNNGLGGVFMRVFRSDSETAEMAGTQVYQVNEYTAFDQIHSQVAMATNGNFVVAYESYQDPTNEENSDMVDNFGIYARRYALTSAVVTTESTTSTTSGNGNNNQTSTVTVISTETVYGLEEVGAEFRVSRSNPFDPNGDDDDQLGVSVAVDSNGDMVFVWTDQSYPDDNIENVVCMRSITLPHDDTPPYVVRANAVYTDGAGDPQQVSLYANSVTFPSGGGPTSLVYSFNEYMFTAQMNADIKNGVFVDQEKYDGVYAYSDNRNLENKNVKSVIDFNDWTLTKDGYNVTSTYIYDILYGYNASTKVEDYLRSIGEEPGKYTYTTVADPDYATNSYELVILFKQTLPDGSYVLTLSDKVTDACGKNNLDGDYNGVAGGSFSVRWTIGIPSVGPNDYLPPSDSTAFTGLYGGEGEPVVVSNADGFIIVTEQQVLYELGGNSSGGTNNNNNNNN
ncbi:MAG: trypsin-like serine protease, partial [Thermoguttaceae bacterium]|nr:trypsin-like serine protease [Thermoguttaceae bacterium]